MLISLIVFYLHLFIQNHLHVMYCSHMVYSLLLYSIPIWYSNTSTIIWLFNAFERSDLPLYWSV